MPTFFGITYSLCFRRTQTHAINVAPSLCVIIRHQLRHSDQINKSEHGGTDRLRHAAKNVLGDPESKSNLRCKKDNRRTKRRQFLDARQLCFRKISKTALTSEEPESNPTLLKLLLNFRDRRFNERRHPSYPPSVRKDNLTVAASTRIRYRLYSEPKTRH